MKNCMHLSLISDNVIYYHTGDTVYRTNVKYDYQLHLWATANYDVDYETNHLKDTVIIKKDIETIELANEFVKDYKANRIFK